MPLVSGSWNGSAACMLPGLPVTPRGESVGEVLAMSVDEALPFFDAHPSIAHPLKRLQDVGLGCLTLGQSSPTLSGGGRTGSSASPSSR